MVFDAVHLFVRGLMVTVAIAAITSPLHGQCRKFSGGLSSCGGSLIMAGSDRSDDTTRTSRLTIDPVARTLDATWNSQLPFSMNDGARWAGRGWSTTVSAGIRVRWNNVRAVIAPEVIYAENRSFPVLPAPPASGLDPFATPWHAGRYRIDQPSRFGTRPTVQLWWGQSVVEATFGAVGLGVSTEDLWWGPGIRNALVMSSNAGGFSHVFVRSARPLRTPLGAIEARYVLGALTESRFFDTDASNDTRSLNAFVATLRPRFDTSLTIGVSRAVFSDVPRPTAIGSGAFSAFLAIPREGRDQVQSLFARWAIPPARLAVHAEWARLRFPAFREWFIAPHRTQGYTVGARWAGDSTGGRRHWGLATELTSVEQPVPVNRFESDGFYISSRVPQGYTQRGQIIGAAIGSGGSSQWFHAYARDRRGSIGPVLGRIRWENESYYRTPAGGSYTTHDVSIFGGIRANYVGPRVEVGLELLRVHRLNYLFQSPDFSGWDTGFDSRGAALNVSVALRP